jgi:ADP-ribosylation factor-like protein 13B
MENNANPYGIKALRQMRSKRAPSERLTRKISETYDYFLEKVDPILGECITYLLCEQPRDVAVSMMEFLNAKQNNIFIEAKVGEYSEHKPRRELKVFLATSIGPVVAKLVNRVALERPDDVVGYMVSELKKMIDSPVDATSLAASAAPAVGATTTRPTTAKKEEQPVMEKNIQLAVVGLGGCGKSSILNMLQGKFDSKVRPTIGFRPVSMMLSEDTKVRFYDLGGGKKIRDIWTQYFHDVHGLIYVVDGSVAVGDMKETLEVFSNTVAHSYVTGKPLLVLVNKQDVASATTASAFQNLVEDNYSTLLDNGFVVFKNCSSFVPPEVSEDFQPDSRIEEALSYLLDSVLQQFDRLNERVGIDSKAKGEEEVRKRVAKERKVLKNKIASAFIAQIDADYIKEHDIEAEPENVFSEEEGLIYLASEIGEDVPGLCDMAKQVAAFVGYQKLALTIIGGLKSPVSKKKTPMVWEDILGMVVELRTELNLR